MRFLFARAGSISRRPAPLNLDVLGAYLLALLWVAPLLYAAWTAFREPAAVFNLDLSSGWTLNNLAQAWGGAPWLIYIRNTMFLVGSILIGQFVLCTLAAYAFARFSFRGKGLLFSLVLLQLFILPEVLIVENYSMVSRLGWSDSVWGMGVPYMASAFGVFLLRQAFKQVPTELEDAARIEGCGRLAVLWRVYVPLAKPVYLAYALVSVSTHWNNFLWPLVISSSVSTRPLTVGLSLFGAPESGVSISLISAATLLTMLPLLLGFLLFQRQFMQAFLRSGLR
ncbi:carbohydrate ABC transporter permease [Paenalcaligenes niemegkensis]|uniref:carbohydrate ABC transporter permease n=1 Tax=Paenalcaligenes niemegkensis TaxID=2895469 RepID=UPI001EE81E2C|nr:carbohydrate ABC transporter permease [Paenalcaligenes niemegkensis]MCQ9616703.1 carbohydrate ABC transporter permease [Paenalcaligenes niemegkensis]